MAEVVRERVYETPQVTRAVRPTDIVRWGPVLAGMFAALATLITLTILGVAVGLSSYNYGDPASTFGIGAGIWGAFSALVAFFIGGWLAGRSAAFSGSTSGLLNGAMVWFVAIPLLIYGLGSGLGALARTAGSVAGTAAQVAGQVAGAAANNPAVQATAADPGVQATVVSGAQQAAGAVQATAAAVVKNVTPTDVNNAVGSAGSAAWGVLLSLGLAAAAAVAGGFVGGKPRETVVRA